METRRQVTCGFVVFVETTQITYGYFADINDNANVMLKINNNYGRNAWCRYYYPVLGLGSGSACLYHWHRHCHQTSRNAPTVNCLVTLVAVSQPLGEVGRNAPTGWLQSTTLVRMLLFGSHVISYVFMHSTFLLLLVSINTAQLMSLIQCFLEIKFA